MTALLAILVVLNVADVYLTLRILKQGGSETWATMAPLVKRFGAKGLWIGKLAVAALVYALWSEDVPWQLIAGLDLFYVWVVRRNLHEAGLDSH